ncbi:MAG TPA: glycosyl hydrolase [Acidimicrobiales bacterium]|nr:glycosyl hydrolase [Acidimicrobiales bacterium]
MAVRGWRFAVLAVGLTAALIGGAEVPTGASPSSLDTKTACLYPHNSLATLASTGRAVGRPYACAMVYNTAAPTWQEWASPWFTHDDDPDQDFAAWLSGAPGRLLVISQAMVPTKSPADWAHAGATGAYDGWIRTLAGNLVAAGMGGSIIRLGFEANGDWNIDSVGSTPSAQADWRAYWARFVSVVRSVPGAHFQFDWTVNAGWRGLPLAAWYPGDAAVDIVGVDFYDTSAAHRTYQNVLSRWAGEFGEPDGPSQVIAFANAHHKPLSIPEWGVVQTSKWGAGDNPVYVNGIASVVANNAVRYQGYFDATTGGVIPLTEAPRALANYRAHFGPGGDAAR